jgi:cobalt-zinc-cadmium resistance protein CzcA
MEVKNQLAQNESGRRIYQSQLQALLNNKSQVPIESGPLIKLEANFPVDTGVLAQSPHLLYAKQQIDVNSKARKVEMSKVLPDFTIGYFNQTLIGYQNINGSDQYFNASKRFTGFQVGVSLPIWIVPQISKVKAAEFNKKIAESNFEQYQVALQSQYQQYFQEYLQNKTTVDFYEKNVLPNAELMISHATKSFKSGDIGYVEYLQNIKNGLSIKTAHLANVNQYNQSVLKLESLTGKK